MINKVGLNSQEYNKSTPSTGEGLISSVRVKKIILDNKTYPTLFNEFGEWGSIGLVFFEPVQVPYEDKDFESNKGNHAYPLFPNYKNYPLENEIIYIISLPSTDIQSNTTAYKNYYFTPVNIWNSIHHNAIPDNIYNQLLPEQQKKDYQQTSDGNVRKVADGGTEIRLGNTFQEKINIKSLQPFEGDVIYEGRWGNSIRFSSTIKNSPLSNPWSVVGESGDPLIIIRNGQKEDNIDSWIPTTEDINSDKANIYLTSNQLIPINVVRSEYKSYSNPPIKPKDYNNPQIILSSGRLVFNASKDSILLSANKSINLNSEYVNFDAQRGMIVASPKIYLGDKKASEPLLLGNKTIDLLKQILVSLKGLSAVLPTVGTTQPNTPNVKVAEASAKLNETLTQLIPQLSNLKSKQNFTL